MYGGVDQQQGYPPQGFRGGRGMNRGGGRGRGRGGMMPQGKHVSLQSLSLLKF